MKRSLWFVSFILAPAGLHAQANYLVEYWTGLDTAVVLGGKAFFYTGTGNLTVGGVPVPIGTITQIYAMGWDSSQHRYEYNLNRSDATGFPGFNFSISNEPMEDTLYVQRNLFTMEFFPFLDVRDTTFSPAGLHLPVAMELVTAGSPLPDTLPLAGFFDTPLLFAQLDTHTYVPGEWDTIWISGTEPFFLILEDTLPAGSLSYPATCVPVDTLAHHYHILFEDTVRMWDGSDMLLHLDRHYWMVPGCFIVKDSVYRTLSPLAAKGKAAQSQTLSTNVGLENIVSVEESTPDAPSPLRLVMAPGGMRVEGMKPGYRVQVMDLSGRRVLAEKGMGVLNLPAGRYMVVVEDPASGTRWVLKGISVR